MHGAFRRSVQDELEVYLSGQSLLQDPEGMRIDLHCHDRNSTEPDETLGRLLGLPESWLPTEELFLRLRRNGADVLTVTNHNNARSCWESLEKGEDLLSAAEFSCSLPEYKVGVHVLTFGFTPGQEEILNRLRKNLYRFLEYTCAHDIPTVLAHPLHFYSPGGTPPLEIMDQFALLFERFEGLNGQRDAWQNLLTIRWVQNLDEEYLRNAARRTGLRPGDFCRHPLRKRLVGGSDCHMGIFAGSAGTVLHSPGWRQSVRPRSQLALEALRSSPSAPFGKYFQEQKLTAAFLHYFCQATERMEDPGALNLMFAKAEPQQKFIAMAIANGVFELRRHKQVSRFLKMFQESLHGKRPGWMARTLAGRFARPILSELESIAAVGAGDVDKQMETLSHALPRIFTAVNSVLARRTAQKIRGWSMQGNANSSDLGAFQELNVPVQLRNLLRWDMDSHAAKNSNPDLKKYFQGLPFPFLATTVMAGCTIAAAKTLYGNRRFAARLAEAVGVSTPPPRVLWLTDTLFDRNGVSRALQSVLGEVRRLGLPIDFLTCGGVSSDHVRSIPSLAHFELPFYPDQMIHIPGISDLHEVFREGAYDRVICSTEAPMGFLALYLKHAFSVPAYFYAHSDWLDYTQRILKFAPRKQERFQKTLGTFYGQFDGLFVLNGEQQKAFSLPAMGVPPEKIFRTAHWADSVFHPRAIPKSVLFPGVAEDEPVLLYAGRLASEKGVLELPEIFRAIRGRIPKARMVFAGTGPCLEALRSAFPEAIFLGWLDSEKLAEVFSAATLFLFPSWYDTFSCSLLEALSCGLPAIAFRTKGPQDILEGEQGGLLTRTADDMAIAAIHLLENPLHLRQLSIRALRRASDFKRDAILSDLLQVVGGNDRTESRVMPRAADFFIPAKIAAESV